MDKFVAISGPAGSGKGTAAEVLVQAGWIKVKFAAPFKDMTRVFLTHVGLDEETIERCIEGDLKETTIPHLGVTPRHIMLTLGTEWGRDQIRTDLWAHLAADKVMRLLYAGHKVVVDDLRFLNEFETVKSLGACVMRIEGRGGLPRAHVSEQELPADIVFNNHGDISMLRSFMEYVFLRKDVD